MAKAKKKETLTPEERLQAVLVPDWEQPYKVPENWCWIHLLDSFENCTDSKKKIPQKEYLQDGKIAVVDQGQNLIGGYTNDREMIFAGNVPVIIFGDHTRCMFAKEQQVKQVAETVVEQIDLIKKSILSRAFRGELGTNNQNEESAVELVKEVVEKSVEINNKPKTKRTVIPEEIKSALSSSNEEEIIRLLIKSAPKAVSVQMIMSISKKKFELMDALRSLEQKQIVIKNSLGEYLLKR